MSSLKCATCQQITKDYFGDRVSLLLAFLASNGASTLRDIVVRGGIPRSKAVTDLKILIQHNFVIFDKLNETAYSANVDFIVQRTRLYSFVMIARKLFGEEAEMVLLEFLKHGMIQKEKCIEDIVSKVQVDSEADFKDKLVHVFKKLENNFLIKRIKINSNLNNDDDNDDNKRSNDDGKGSKGKKRIREEDSDDDDDPNDDDPKSSDDYALHMDKLNELLRHHHISQAVRLSQGEECAIVMETILQHSYTTTSHLNHCTPGVSYNELINIMRNDKMTKTHLGQYLSILYKYEPSFLIKCDDSGGGSYRIDFQKAFKELCTKHLNCCIEEIYGSKAKNIFNIILSSVMIEENEMEKRSRDPDSVRAILAKLRKDQYVSTMSFPKTSDFNSLSTIYVYKVDLDRVARLTLERCYKAAANLIMRRVHETDSNKRLLEIQSKLDVVFSQMEDDGQKDELEQTYISATEQETLKKFRKNIDMLDNSEIQLDDTTFVMESYMLMWNVS